jgi:hypothetical protein
MKLGAKIVKASIGDQHFTIANALEHSPAGQAARVSDPFVLVFFVLLSAIATLGSDLLITFFRLKSTDRFRDIFGSPFTLRGFECTVPEAAEPQPKRPDARG